jgi:hypothetical protein
MPREAIRTSAAVTRCPGCRVEPGAVDHAAERTKDVVPVELRSVARGEDQGVAFRWVGEPIAVPMERVDASLRRGEPAARSHGDGGLGTHTLERLAVALVPAPARIGTRSA